MLKLIKQLNVALPCAVAMLCCLPSLPSAKAQSLRQLPPVFCPSRSSLSHFEVYQPNEYTCVHGVFSEVATSIITNDNHHIMIFDDDYMTSIFMHNLGADGLPTPDDTRTLQLYYTYNNGEFDFWAGDLSIVSSYFEEIKYALAMADSRLSFD